MQYPIFQFIVNTIQSALKERDIDVSRSRVWEESKINATGLEIVFDLSRESQYLDNLQIHFDWDSFRERKLARQLKGTGNHPLLKQPAPEPAEVASTLDVELIWTFNVASHQPGGTSHRHMDHARIENASKWMEQINERLRILFMSRQLLSRWHLDIEGDEKGRRLKSTMLITYFQYSMDSVSDLSEVQTLISRRVKHLLFVSRKVAQAAESIIPTYAAA